MVMGRAALTAPLALAVSDALRLRDREPAAAVLGLATWMGAGPMVFLFLGASPLTLLTWGLLPEASRQRFDWVHWFVAALPLGVFLGLGGLAALFLLLRPGRAPALSRERLDLQFAVLGPVTRRELAMVAILLLTVAGWVAAPALRLEMGTVALLGLLGAALAGNFDGGSLQELDWDYLIFFGVALTLGGLVTSLGLDRSLAEAVGQQMSGLGVGALPFVLSVAVLTILVRLVLLPEPAVLLVNLAVIPIAPSVGVEPWVAVVTTAATYLLWYIPSQTPEYLVAYSGSEGRLYSHDQARRVSFAYAAVTLAGLALAVPYWHLLGLL
jgi:divalent anion:Na+ symporter, DASS family